MSPDSLDGRAANDGLLADDDSIPDPEQPSFPSSPASADEPRAGPSPPASRTAGMGNLITRLNRQNLWPDAEGSHPKYASTPAAAPSSPSDVDMLELDGQNETGQLRGDVPMQVAADEIPESISGLQGLSRAQHLRLMRRSGPADQTRLLSLLKDMMEKADQCNVRRSSLLRAAAARPTAAVAAPLADAPAAPSSTATSVSATTTRAAPAAGASANSLAAAPTATPAPSQPQPVPGEGFSGMLEADSGEEDGDEEWQRWQKERETAALLRAAKTPAGVRKNGLARMHYTSQEVALRCPNVVLNKTRMRKRRKPGEDPGKTSGRGSAPRASAPAPQPSAAVPAAPTSSTDAVPTTTL